VGKQCAGHRLGFIGGNGNLEPVLARIAGAGQMAGDPVKTAAPRIHENHLGGLPRMASQHLACARALQREEG